MRRIPPHVSVTSGGWRYTLQAVGSLLWIAQAWLIAGVVAELMRWAAQSSPSASALWPVVVQASIGVAGLGLLRAALEYSGARATYGYARHTLTALRQALGDCLRSTSPIDARRPPSGQITSVWMEQAEAVVPWLARYQAAQWRVLLVSPAIALVVAWHSWVAALVLLLAAPLIPLFMAIIGWRAQAISEKQLQALGHLHGHLLERLRGLPTLRALHAVDATANRLTQLGKDVAQKTMRVLGVAMLSSAVLELFSALGVALVAVYVGFHLLGELPFGAWGQQLGLHSALFILMLAPSFFEPLRDLSAVWHDRANGRAAMQALHEALDGLAPLVVSAGAGANTPPQEAHHSAANMGPRVQLIGVRPALGGDAHTASSILPWTLDIPAGAHVAITGASGSGKSMLMALIAGLMRAECGEVRIDGVRMDDRHADTMRARMAWMGQQPFFFSGSISRNLSLGHPSDPAQEVAAMRAVDLQAVAHPASGVRLGEAGSGISGGEALRLALARLALRPHANLLLMDEPTAHLDEETARIVRSTIAALSQNKTVLIATHDPVLMETLPYILHLDGHGQGHWLRHPAFADRQEVQA